MNSLTKKAFLGLGMTALIFSVSCNNDVDPPVSEIDDAAIETEAIAQSDFEEIDDITTTITRGGKRVSSVVKKYQLITNHTARRSFATNLYLAKVPTLAIMKMTGHKTEKSFLKYIRVTSEENAINIAQHPYFAT